VWEDFSIHLDNQILGSFNLVNAVAPIMESNGYGKIVLIGSQAIETPSHGLIPYITAKGALSSFAKAMAIDLAKYGIRVNVVSPGMTDTKQLSGWPERVLLTTAAKTPLKRLGLPEDVANAIVFLASNNSDYLTGETIRVNGGQVML
jgi:3-oxoacyl-[acyl-carrier protein] reductase